MHIKAVLPVLSRIVKVNNLPDYLAVLCGKILQQEMGIIELVDQVRHLNVHSGIAKSDFTSLILDYLEFSLEDDNLSEDEKGEILFLKRLFGIRAEDFYAYQQRRMEEMIDKRLDNIYDDDNVDLKEEILKDDLQEVLGLSYDEMNEHAKRWAKNSILKGGKLENLDVLFTHDEYRKILQQR